MCIQAEQNTFNKVLHTTQITSCTVYTPAGLWFLTLIFSHTTYTQHTTAWSTKLYGHGQHAEKFGEVRPCGFRVMRVDRQTDTQTKKHTHHNTHSVGDEVKMHKTRYSCTVLVVAKDRYLLVMEHDTGYFFGVGGIGVNFCKAVRLEPPPTFQTPRLSGFWAPTFCHINAYYEAVFCGVANKKWL